MCIWCVGMWLYTISCSTPIAKDGGWDAGVDWLALDWVIGQRLVEIYFSVCSSVVGSTGRALAEILRFRYPTSGVRDI